MLRVEKPAASGKAAPDDEQAWFKQLFELSPDPTWIIEGNQFIECNEAAVKTLGYSSRAELLNVHPSKLSPQTQPDGQNSYEKAERIFALVQTNGLHRFEWTHTKADGTDFVAEVTLSTIQLSDRQVIYCIWRDIIERKVAEESQRIAAATFESQQGTFITDANKVILQVNKAFTKVTGYTAQEAVGQTPGSVSYTHLTLPTILRV